MKVSFDFDATLTIDTVEEYAKELVQRQIEVWICTTRYEPDLAPTKEWNDDLFALANECGISRNHIIFCNFEDKYHHLKERDFVFHVDDDNDELRKIDFHTNVMPIVLFANDKWRSDCETAMFNYTKSYG